MRINKTESVQINQKETTDQGEKPNADLRE